MAVVTDAVVVFVTAPSEDEAGRIAKGVVDAHLAACVTLTHPVRSIYRWKGETRDEKESLLIIKTRRDVLDRLTDWVRSHHPYEVPEILAIPVASGYPPYLEWLSNSLDEKDAE